jgi:hypothetical protein
VKYVLLIHDSEAEWDRLNEAELQQVYEESDRLIRQITSRGQYLGGHRLQPTSAATSVRVRNGKRLVTDGPFAETREQLGGYFLIEAKDLDEAIDIAARHPVTRLGTIEVRPIMEDATPAKEVASRDGRKSSKTGG